MNYRFFYDETEHSRKINYRTISAENYFDNFISVIVGWPSKDDEIICNKYLEFEAKYEYRKKNGELKSQTMKMKDFRFGFASLNNNTIEFYEDLLSFLDEKIIIYFSIFSKLEYVISQLFSKYNNSMFIDADAMKYSIIKAINQYQPNNVIKAIYKEPHVFVIELRSFLQERIEKNQNNKKLKELENNAFKDILRLLVNTELPKNLDWSYSASFDGFKKLLEEMSIEDYDLMIDKEGDGSHTLNSAKLAGIKNAIEVESKDFIGIRIADMLAGMISKLIQALKKSLTANYKDGKNEKTLLDPDWFALNQRQLDLYKKMFKVICVNNHYWFKAYSGIYSDDLVSFIALLQFMNHFNDAAEICKSNLEIQPEYYNTYVCNSLHERYEIMRNKLPLNMITNKDNDYFYNKRGAKVYLKTEKQPLLPLHEGQNEYNVLSVGFSRDETPMVTVTEKNIPICYKLPKEYSEWAMNVVGIANLGEKLFPANVVFSLIGGKYYVDIY